MTVVSLCYHSNAYSIPIPPALSAGSFFASSDLIALSPWQYTGTLPIETKGFTAVSHEECDTRLFGRCIFPLRLEEQSTTGGRSLIVNQGANPSYEQKLTGAFNTDVFEVWDGSLLDKSKEVTQDDVESVSFNAGDEHPIPLAWQSAYGYQTPIGGYAAFSTSLQPKSVFFDPGQYNCPLATLGQCQLQSLYLAAGANIESSLSGNVNLSDNVSDIFDSTELATIQVAADRLTSLVVNNETVFSNQVDGSAQNFELEENTIKKIAFEVGATASTGGVTVYAKANPEWSGQGDTSSFAANYSSRNAFKDIPFIDAGLRNTYSLQIKDDPGLIAGIIGNNFTSATVSSSVGMSGLEVFTRPVAQPLASGNLAPTFASGGGFIQPLRITNKSSSLAIPSGGFSSGDTFNLSTQVRNSGAIDISIDSIFGNIFDADIFGDDLLASFHRPFSGLTIHPGSSTSFLTPISIAQSALNAATRDGFFNFEGDFLDLIGNGGITFTDVFGTRTKEYQIATVDTPPSFFMMLVGIIALWLSRYGIDIRCLSNFFVQKKAPLQKKSECKTGSLIPIANWSKHQTGVQSGGFLLSPLDRTSKYPFDLF